MIQNNSPSPRDKRPRDEPSDDDTSPLMTRREAQKARLSDAIQQRAVESGRQSPRSMSPAFASTLMMAAAAGGPSVKRSLAETPSSSEEPAAQLSKVSAILQMLINDINDDFDDSMLKMQQELTEEERDELIDHDVYREWYALHHPDGMDAGEEGSEKEDDLEDSASLAGGEATGDEGSEEEDAELTALSAAAAGESSVGASLAERRERSGPGITPAAAADLLKRVQRHRQRRALTAAGGPTAGTSLAEMPEPGSLPELNADEASVSSDESGPPMPVAGDSDSDNELVLGGSLTLSPNYEEVYQRFARPTGDYFKIGSSFVKWDAKLDGGKFVIMSEKNLKIECRHWQYWKPPKKEGEEPYPCSFIDAWLKDPQIDPHFSGNEDTRCYWERSGVYPPPLKPPSNDTFNYWPGLAADRVELEMDADTMKWLEFFLEHLNLLLNRNAKSFEFVLDWLAHAVQYPAIKVGIMLCFLGDRRIGKTAVWNMMVKVFGEAACFETEEPDGNVWGKGNSPMLSAYIVRIKETTRQKMAANMGALRGCITDERMPIRPLYAGSFNINSFHRFFLDSNYYDAVPFTKGEGKAAIFNCSAEKKGDAAYFRTLFAKCINNPKVVRAFYELLKRRKVKEMYQEEDIPQSDFSKQLQECNISIAEKFAYHLIDQRYLANDDCEEFYLTEPDLTQAFKDWKANGGSLFDKANSSIVKELGLGNIEGVKTMVRAPRRFFDGRQPRCSVFKNMEMRKRYGIGEDMQDPNDELRVGAATDAPAPIDCHQLLKTAFSELDFHFDW